MDKKMFTVKSECDGLDLDITVFEPKDEIRLGDDNNEKN